MEFTDYLLWKFIAIIVIAFLAGLFGFIDDASPAKGEGSDKRLE